MARCVLPRTVTLPAPRLPARADVVHLAPFRGACPLVVTKRTQCRFRSHPDGHNYTSFLAFFRTLRTASAIWSISERGPRSVVCISQRAVSQSRSLAGHWICSRYSEMRLGE